MPLAADILDQDDLAGGDDAAFAVAGGELDSGIEIDDVLPPRRRVPVEIVDRRHLAEDDAGGGQPARQLAAASFLDPFDLDVAEMALALGIGVEIVDAHDAPSLLRPWPMGAAPPPLRHCRRRGSHRPGT